MPPKLIAIFETTHAEFRQAVYATERSAAMAIVPLYYELGADPIAPVNEHWPALLAHLQSTPVHLRCLYLSWFATWQTGGWHGGPVNVDWNKLDKAAPLAQATHLAGLLAGHGFGRGSIPFLYLDQENPWRLEDGNTDPNAPLPDPVADPDGMRKMAAYLRACTKPLKDLLGCERINYTYASPKKEIVEWSGYKRTKGATIDRTDSVDCYTSKPGDFVRVMRNVLDCDRSGKVAPHLPPLITEHQTQAEAESQIRAMMHTFAAKAILAVPVAAYMWPADKQAELVRAVTGSMAEAEAAHFDVANTVGVN
jgi:hypothetical protein